MCHVCLAVYSLPVTIIVRTDLDGPLGPLEAEIDWLVLRDSFIVAVHGILIVFL